MDFTEISQSFCLFKYTAFNQQIANYELHDIPLNNGRFIWSTSSLTKYLSLSDRFLLTDACIAKYGSMISKWLNSITSNHFPLFLTLSNIDWGTTPICFENAQLTIPFFRAMVEVWWNNHPHVDIHRHELLMKIKGTSFFPLQLE